MMFEVLLICTVHIIFFIGVLSFQGSTRYFIGFLFTVMPLFVTLSDNHRIFNIIGVYYIILIFNMFFSYLLEINFMIKKIKYTPRKINPQIFSDLYKIVELRNNRIKLAISTMLDATEDSKVKKNYFFGKLDKDKMFKIYEDKRGLGKLYDVMVNIDKFSIIEYLDTFKENITKAEKDIYANVIDIDYHNNSKKLKMIVCVMEFLPNGQFPAFKKYMVTSDKDYWLSFSEIGECTDNNQIADFIDNNISPLFDKILNTSFIMKPSFSGFGSGSSSGGFSGSGSSGGGFSGGGGSSGGGGASGKW